MSTFTQDKAIYLQICDRIMDEILSGTYAEDHRVPSVRDYAATLQVNINTAVKAYEELSRQEIIYQRRGMGYFVTAGARSAILQQRREQFMQRTLTELFRQMQMLDISIEDVTAAYQCAVGQPRT